MDANFDYTKHQKHNRKKYEKHKDKNNIKEINDISNIKINSEINTNKNVINEEEFFEINKKEEENYEPNKLFFDENNMKLSQEEYDSYYDFLTQNKKEDLNSNIMKEFNKKGKIKDMYLNNSKKQILINVPHFSYEKENEIKEKDIIDFRPLEQNEIERRYYDNSCCLKERKIIYNYRYYCRLITDNSVFDFISLLIIIKNCILLFIFDEIGKEVELYFLIFYLLEAILKIFGHTFFISKNAYIRDYWNILDFIVVIIGIITLIIENVTQYETLTGIILLRYFLILRPFKIFKRLKNLKKVAAEFAFIIISLIEGVLFLFFFLLIFAIMGLQMWRGLFKKRCMNLNYGYFFPKKNNANYMCYSDRDCSHLNTFGEKYICAKDFINPNSNIINFDNIFHSLITTFMVLTLEGWSSIYTYISKTFKEYPYLNQIITFLYFQVFIYIGSFFLINILFSMAIVEFIKIKNKNKENQEKNPKKSNDLVKLIKDKYILRKENKNNKKILYKENEEEEFIPRKYSTVKDILVINNTSPENLYLEKIKIENEKKKLSEKNDKQNVKIEFKNENMNNKENILTNTCLTEEIYLLSRVDENKMDKIYKNNIISNNNVIKIKNKINREFIEFAVNETEKHIFDLIHSKYYKKYYSKKSKKIEVDNSNKNKKTNKSNNNNVYNKNGRTDKFNALKKGKKKKSIKNRKKENNIKEENINIKNEKMEENEEKDSIIFNIINDNLNDDGKESNNIITKKNDKDDNNKIKHISKIKNKNIDDINYSEKKNIKDNKNRNVAFELPDKFYQKNYDNILLNNKKKIKIVKYKNKSVDKNINKYPKKNSNEDKINNRNDSLTYKQKNIPLYMRSKINYINYLFNIQKFAIKINDRFKINDWQDEVLGKKGKNINLKINEANVLIPGRLEPFYSFNDKKSALKKSKYIYYKENNFFNNNHNILYLPYGLKNLPLNILTLAPNKIRNFCECTSDKKENLQEYQNSSTKLLINIEENSKYYNPHSGRVGINIKRKKENMMINREINKDKMSKYIYKMNINDKINQKINEFDYSNLNHYIINEEKLYYSLVKQKKREEYIKNIKESNNIKNNKLNVIKEIKNIEEYDEVTRSRRYIIWSGGDVLYRNRLNVKNYNQMINSLENLDSYIFNENIIISILKKIGLVFSLIAENNLFSLLIYINVIINAIFMGFEGNAFKPETLNELKKAKNIFNSIYIFEYVVKFIGLSPIIYFSNPIIFVDTFIVSFAILELALPNDVFKISFPKTINIEGLNISLTIDFKIFRFFFAVRIIKILNLSSFFKTVIKTIIMTFLYNFYTIFGSIIIFLSFHLLGTVLFYRDGYYTSFIEGFYTTYQILSLEQWDKIFLKIWSKNPWCIIYFIVWIIFGNYILFNLSILFFLNDENNINNSTDDITESEEQKIEKYYKLPKYLNSIKNEIKNENEPQNLNIKNDNSNKKTIENKQDDSYSFSDDEEEYGLSILIEMKRKEKEMKELYSNNHCVKSLFIFPQYSRFRIFCMKLINKSSFYYSINFIIVLNIIKLIIETFFKKNNSLIIFNIIELIFIFAFLIEFLLKLIALGFCINEGTYLRNNYNKIDFILLILSLFDISNFISIYNSKNINSSSYHGLILVSKISQAFRALRLITHINKLKYITTSFLASIIPISILYIILFIILYMISIIGIYFFYDYYYNCYTETSNGLFILSSNNFQEILTIYEIPNNIVSINNFCYNKFNGIMNYGPNFIYSNIKTSLFNSYFLLTKEGLADIMKSHNIFNIYFGLYFVIMNLFIYYFLLNLIAWITTYYFYMEYNKDEILYIENADKYNENKKAKKYYDFLVQLEKMINAKKNYEIKTINNYKLKTINMIIENILIFAIIFNIIIMLIIYDECPKNYILVLNLLNYILIGFFLIELIFKLILYKKEYFNSLWNIYDFLVVIISIFYLVLRDGFGIDISFLKIFQIIRIFEILTNPKFIKEFKCLKRFEKTIQTIQRLFWPVIYLLLEIIIFYSIFALLLCIFEKKGSYNIYDSNKNSYINEFFNLNNFYNAYLLLFRCSTGENWPNIMMEIAYDNKGKNSGFIIALFIISIFVISIILLRLFFMLIIKLYYEYNINDYNCNEKYNLFMDNFNDIWNEFCDKDERFKMNRSNFYNFLQKFKWKNLSFTIKNQNMVEYIYNLKLYTDNEGYIFYHDIIFKIIYQQMGSKFNKNDPEYEKILLKEKSVIKRIRNKIDKYRNGFISIYMPYTSYLNYKISYNYLKLFLFHYKEKNKKKDYDFINNISEEFNKYEPGRNEIIETHIKKKRIKQI